MEASERFARLSALFERFSELAQAEQAESISRVREQDPEMAAELRQMLAFDAQSDEGDDPVWAVIAPAAEALTASPVIGKTIGAWRPLEIIGEGGMGTVYLAERNDGEFESRAAIKLLHGGAPSPRRDRRFRTERQILARLSHPGIATLLDGGTTDDGSPFLVMEFVDGQTITQWCDDHGLSVQGRIEVFLAVCDAVAYAHQALVAHLDLKPSNVLVDDNGAVKLLDFGIAKLLGDDDVVTVSGSLMTPAYASPEQLSGEPTGVAADVYSLGVILFELLTGRLPVVVDGGGLGAWVRAVADGTIPSASSVAPRGRQRPLRGALDAILSRALRKDPTRRYASVQSFAEDLRRHLDGRAVSARGSDRAYRLLRFAGRNWIPLTAAIGVTLGALGFAGYAVQQNHAIQRERDAVERERVSAQRASTFLQELLMNTGPQAASGPDVTIRELLDRGAEQLRSGFEDQPRIRAELSMVVGSVYREWGAYEEAEPLLDLALELYAGLDHADARAVAAAEVERAALAYNTGAYDDSLALLDKGWQRLDIEEPGDHSLKIEIEGLRCSTYMMRSELDEAEASAQRAVDMAKRVYPRPSERVAGAMVSIADVLRAKTEWEASLAFAGEAAQDYRAVFGDTHLEVAHALSHMAETLHKLERDDEALPLAQEALGIRRAAFDGAHVEIGASLGGVAGILASLGRTEDAEAARRESLAVFREALDDEHHPYIAGTLSSLGEILVAAEKYEEAEAVLRDSVAEHREAYPGGSHYIAMPLTQLGRLMLTMERPAEAEPMLREGLQARLDALGDDHFFVAVSRVELGRALDALGRDAEAEELLLRGHGMLLDRFGAEDWRIVPSQTALHEHYSRRGLPRKAAAFAPP
ncbi:MAG: protein kinase domain-containing protein [Nannocystales bacterium]